MSHKIHPEALEPGEYLMFINSERNKVKLYGTNQVAAYLRHKHDKIDMRTVALIPRAFHASGRFNYDESLRHVLERYLPLQERD